MGFCSLEGPEKAQYFHMVLTWALCSQYAQRGGSVRFWSCTKADSSWQAKLGGVKQAKWNKMRLCCTCMLSCFFSLHDEALPFPCCLHSPWWWAQTSCSRLQGCPMLSLPTAQVILACFSAMCVEHLLLWSCCSFCSSLPTACSNKAEGCWNSELLRWDTSLTSKHTSWPGGVHDHMCSCQRKDIFTWKFNRKPLLLHRWEGSRRRNTKWGEKGMKM